MLCYLASPIDTCEFNSEFNQRRRRLIDTLSDCGAAVFAPHEAWTIDIGQASLEVLSRLSTVNFQALDEADLVVALVPPGVPTVGTPIEVYHTLVLNEAKVALWSGRPDSDRIGAMWSYLLTNYGPRIYWMPPEPDTEDVRRIVEWAQPKSPALHAIGER